MTILSTSSTTASQQMLPPKPNKASKKKGSPETTLPSSIQLSRCALYERTAHYARRALGVDSFSRQLALLDPLVGDQSCQLRVLLLLEVLGPTRREQPIDDNFLAEVGLLSIIATSELDALGTRRAQKTDKKRLLAHVAAEGTAPTCKVSGGHLDVIVREAKQKLARRSVDALTRLLAQLPGTIATQLGAALQVQQVAVGQDHVSMAPFYAGVAAVLGLLPQFGAPLVFLLRCYGRQDGGFVLYDVAAGLLAANEEHGLQLDVDDPSLQQRPAMVVRLYSAVDARTAAAPSSSSFGAGRCAKDGLRALDTFGARRALLAAAATHPQYAPGAVCRDSGTENFSTKSPDPDLLDLADVAPEVVRAFARDLALGHTHGIGLTPLYGPGRDPSAPRQLFSAPIPLNVEHIFCDSFANMRAGAQEARQRYCGVVMSPPSAEANAVSHG